MADYADILKQQWDNIPKVQVLPVGSYLLKVRKATYQPASSEDKSPRVMFVYGVKEPMDDVDSSELKSLGDNYDLSGNAVFANFFVSTKADWDKVRNHIAKHGVETSGSSIEESLEAVKGAEVIAYLNQRTYKTNAGEDATDNNPTNFAKVE